MLIFICMRHLPCLSDAQCCFASTGKRTRSVEPGGTPFSPTSYNTLTGANVNLGSVSVMSVMPVFWLVATHEYLLHTAPWRGYTAMPKTWQEHPE